MGYAYKAQITHGLLGLVVSPVGAWQNLRFLHSQIVASIRFTISNNKKMKQMYLKSALLIATAIVMGACSESDKKEIVCWGDSLTAPHNSKSLKGKVRRLIKGADYPEYLQEILGDEYQIINGGVGGENTLTIMARQGAYPMKLAHDITIFNSGKSEFPIFIGNNDLDAFISTYNGKCVTPLLQCGWNEDSPSHINPCMISGKMYHLVSKSKFWKEEGKYIFEYNYYINPDREQNITDTIKAGSRVTTYAMQHLRNKYANVFFIGQNGGFDDTADLIRQLRAMISYSKSSRYIIISFHKPNSSISSISRMKEMEDSLQLAFREHYINLRQYMVTCGLKDSGLKATKEDKDSIAKGQVPPQLMTDGTHFTSTGYKRIAQLVFEKMKELGY